MKSLLLLTILTFACSNPESDSQLQNTFGEDDRERLDLNSAPGSSIGRLEDGCTAFLVGKNLAMTAAHCVLNIETGRMKETTDRFDLAYEDGKAKASARINAAWIGSLQPVTERRSDWAILWLDQDLGTKAGWFGLTEGLTPIDLPATVRLAGYASDIDEGEYPVMPSPCYIHHQDPKARLLHDCDASKGTSGGPIFVEQPTGNYLVAMTVSEFLHEGAEESLHREKYSHEFANIAVNANEFYATLASIKSTVENGISAPDDLEAFYLLNTNPKTNDENPIASGERRAPTQPIEPPPVVTPTPLPRVDVETPRLSLQQESFLLANRIRINHQTKAMLDIVNGMEQQAKMINWVDFLSYSTPVKNHLIQLMVLSHNTNIGSMSIQQSGPQIYNAHELLRRDSSKLLNYYRQTPGGGFFARNYLDTQFRSYTPHLDGLFYIIKPHNRY